MKKWILGFLFLISIAVLGISAKYAIDYYGFIGKPLSTPVNFEYEVKKGSHIGAIAADLASRGWLEEPLLLRVLAKHQGLSAIKAGLYTFEHPPLPEAFLQTLNRGDVKQFSVTFVEGWTYRDWLAELDKHPHITKTLDRSLTPSEQMVAIASKQLHPEGWFFPDTYFYHSNTKDTAILFRAHQKMEAFLNATWQSETAPEPLTDPYQVLIMASIVEKETGVARERPEIAGVFMRRLRKKMRLETDPTVIYGLGDSFDGNLTRKHLRTYSPYNTYKIKGLPPTPIAMPSGAAIKAVMNPKAGDSLFFVSKGDGSHYFSATLEEHNRAVRKYQLKR